MNASRPLGSGLFYEAFVCISHQDQRRDSLLGVAVVQPEAKTTMSSLFRECKSITYFCLYQYCVLIEMMLCQISTIANSSPRLYDAPQVHA